jgi:ubiquinone/menaquinone biosynthesis C-methylase UbiE
MDILTRLNEKTGYTTMQLQFILGAWVMSKLGEGKSSKIKVDDGDVNEGDYNKGSIYSLLYSLYRSVGTVKSDTGEAYELTFNTWGYVWPPEWDTNPTTSATDPQRFGKNAYTGLFQSSYVKDYVAKRDGKVHVVEMGCGTGAGAHHVCSKVLPKCTYESVDMQRAAIETCRRKFVPELGGRLVATHANATKLDIKDGAADIVAVCETHVTEHAGQCGDEDQRFFQTMYRLLKPGGLFVWGNAIPDSTWKPCFEYLESIGMKKLEEHDVTALAVQARDEDKGRVDAYCEQAIKRFYAFQLPVIGRARAREARMAMENFYRNPGTNLYRNMVKETDTYRVVVFEKTA